MTELSKVRHLLRLKEVNRYGRVGERQESTAEHIYGAMILAQHFSKMVPDLDGDDVLKFILYHDLVEIESGDVFILDEEQHLTKFEKEKKAAEILKKKIPANLEEEFWHYFNTYEAQETREAKFTKAIDQLEPMIHWLDYKPMWREYGFTEAVLRRKKEHYMKEFAVLHTFFEALLVYLKENDYIDTE